jgi:TonB family protein
MQTRFGLGVERVWLLFTFLGVLAFAPWAAAQPLPAKVAMPELLSPLRPEYPSNGTSDARVVLKVTLDNTGAVTDVVVVDGVEPFASAALRAARAARFAPARRGSDAIAATITIAVDFTFAAEESAPEVAAPESAAPPRAKQPTAAPGSAPALPSEDEAIDIIVLAPRVDDTERLISKAEARMTAGTFGDPLRAVELLPGITPLISGVPYFFVRGAPAGSVNFYIDEARIPQLYHVGPGSSVLHPQFVEAVALRSGPYRARYGDATSGVVTTRVVTEINEFGAEVEGKLFESAAYVGAPLASGDGAAAVAGKISHLGPLLDAINPQLQLSYWDYQSLLAYDLTSRDQVTLLLFGAGDFVGEEENGVVDVNIDTVFHRLKLGYNRNLSNGVDLHNYAILGLEQSSFDRVNETYRGRSFGVGSSLSYVVNDAWEWASGASMDISDIDASGASGSFGDSHNAAVSRADSQIALWGEGRYSPGRRVKLDAGLRLAGYQSIDARAAAIEPRLSSTVDLAARWKSILAVGVSTQVPTAGVPAPAVRPAELRGDLQRALQRALTVRYSIPQELTAEATGFYNDYFNLSDPLSMTTTPDPLEVGDAPDGSEPPREDLNFDDRPNGRSYGLELLLRRPFTNALSGSIGYTLSRSTRQIGNQDVLSSFDRTHVLNTTAGYDFGSGYAFSTRLMVYSGLPVRRLGDVGGRTGDRSEPFVRVDVRFSKEWELSWSQLMLIVEMLNATFQEETLGVSCLPGGCVTATFGPVTVPSIGLRGTFGGARNEEGDRKGLSR